MQSSKRIPTYSLDAPCRDSSLTFAVVWDPERGIETYSGDALLGLSGVSVPKPKSTNRLKSESETKSREKEPFAVFGSRQPRFIDIRTSTVYERYMGRPGGYGDDGSALNSPPLQGNFSSVRPLCSVCGLLNWP